MKSLLLFLVLGLFLCSFAQIDRLNTMKNPHMTSFPHFPTMYEISTRPWLYELSQKYNKPITRLIDVPRQELEKLKSLGVDIIWMMGVWNLGTYGLEFDRNNTESIKRYRELLPDFVMDDIIGSPYAVYNYSLNHQLGRYDDISLFKKMLNNLGLSLMLDFVPNHSAVDTLWKEDYNLFVRAPKYVNPPYDPYKYIPEGVAYGSDIWGGAWMDTLQLNYWNEKLRNLQVENLLYIANVSDYIRCDMAHLVLNENIQSTWSEQLNSWGFTRPSTEFWKEAISFVKAKQPHVKFLAEVYDPWPSKLHEQGFDYTYDKKLYDHFADGHLDHLRGYIIGNHPDFHKKSAHFVENHDEPRAPVEFKFVERANAAAFASLTLPGMRFINHGQTFGFKNRLDVHLRRAAYENKDPKTVEFYDALLRALKSDAFRNGSWRYLDVEKSSTSWRLISWKWTTEKEHVLCIFNYSDETGEGRVKLNDAKPIQGNDIVQIHELLTNRLYSRSVKEMREQGLHIVLEPWKVQIFKYWSE